MDCLWVLTIAHKQCQASTEKLGDFLLNLVQLAHLMSVTREATRVALLANILDQIRLGQKCALVKCKCKDASIERSKLEGMPKSLSSAQFYSCKSLTIHYQILLVDASVGVGAN